MAYIIKPSKEGNKKGYKVCKEEEKKKCFSKHPLPLERAKKQVKAILISESRKKSKK